MEARSLNVEVQAGQADGARRHCQVLTGQTLGIGPIRVWPGEDHCVIFCLAVANLAVIQEANARRFHRADRGDHQPWQNVQFRP